MDFSGTDSSLLFCCLLISCPKFPPVSWGESVPPDSHGCSTRQQPITPVYSTLA